LAPLKKTIYSMIDLREILLGCNQRYRAFLSSLDDPSAGERDLQRLSQPRIGADPSVKGLNFFDAAEQTLLRTLQLGKFAIHGWRRADLLAHLKLTPSAMSRQLKRLHVLGIIKKVAPTYRYYQKTNFPVQNPSLQGGAGFGRGVCCPVQTPCERWSRTGGTLDH
jgi:hypothetical protein